MADKEFDLKEVYNKLKQKYSDLPSFESINNEFEISSIDEEDFLLRKIRRRVNERVILYCKLIENIIFPNLSNPLSAYETSFMDEQSREKLVKIHKDLMVLDRESLLLDIEAHMDENKELDYILKVLKDWNIFKKEIIELVSNMKEAWKKDLKEDKEFYG